MSPLDSELKSFIVKKLQKLKQTNFFSKALAKFVSIFRFIGKHQGTSNDENYCSMSLEFLTFFNYPVLLVLLNSINFVEGGIMNESD